MKVRNALRKLAETQKGDITYLTDIRPPQWRLRVGDWRVRFKKHTDEKAFEILHIRHRSQAYDR